jgi:iron complex transport system permease protein
MQEPQNRWKRLVTVALLGAGLLGALLVAISLGTVAVPFDQVARMLLSLIPGADAPPTWTEQMEAIVLSIRLPRVVTAMTVGGALALAGTLFQGLLRNPMADPYIIGTSGGAALGATIALLIPAQVLPLGFVPVPVAAFVGSLAAVLAVYAVARVGPRAPITTLLLAGFALSSLMAAAMSFLMLFSGETMRRVVLWTMGGMSSTGWTQLAVVVPLIALGGLAAYLMARDLNAFLLGEDQAAHLGIDVERRKLVLLMVGSLLTGAAVSVSGLVGFVGLVVPHVARLVFGPDHRQLIPTAALLGSIFLVVADLAARLVMAPAEVPVGIVTAVIGAPFFIYMLRRSKKAYDF